MTGTEITLLIIAVWLGLPALFGFWLGFAEEGQEIKFMVRCIWKLMVGPFYLLRYFTALPIRARVWLAGRNSCKVSARRYTYDGIDCYRIVCDLKIKGRFSSDDSYFIFIHLMDITNILRWEAVLCTDTDRRDKTTGAYEWREKHTFLKWGYHDAIHIDERISVPSLVFAQSGPRKIMFTVDVVDASHERLYRSFNRSKLNYAILIASGSYDYGQHVYNDPVKLDPKQPNQAVSNTTVEETLGIKPNMSASAIHDHLLQLHATWNGRVSSAKPAIRKKAAYMLKLIAEAHIKNKSSHGR